MAKYMQYAKFAVAALTAALTAVAGMLPVGSTAGNATQLALVVLGAVAVYFVPNATVKRTRRARKPVAK